MRDRIGEWERFVDTLASSEGYPDGLGLDDYYQDVVNRDFLEEAELEPGIVRRLSEADAKFRSNTVAASQSRLSGAFWWHMRLPTRAGDELKDEATRLGFKSPSATQDW